MNASVKTYLASRFPPFWLLFTIGFYGFVCFGAFEADDAWRNSLSTRLYNPNGQLSWWTVIASQIASELRDGFRYRPAQVIQNHLANYFFLSSLHVAMGYYFVLNILVAVAFHVTIAEKVQKRAAAFATVLGVSLQVSERFSEAIARR